MRSIWHAIKRLRRDRRGVTTVEVALIALPAFMLLMGILETGMVLLKETVMEGATQAAARQVRTGVVQTSADAAARFKTEFCNNLISYSCTDFYFDVRTFIDFTEIVLPAVTFGQNGIPNDINFQPGGAGKVVTVRVIHRHKLVTPMIATLLGASGQELILTSTSVMRTEPYDK